MDMTSSAPPRPDLGALDNAIAAARAAPKLLRKALTGEEPTDQQAQKPVVQALIAAFRDAARASPDQAPWTMLRGAIHALHEEKGLAPAALSLARLALAEARRRAGQDDAAWGGLAQRWELELPSLRYAAAMDQLDAAMTAQIPKEMVPPLDVLIELEQDPERRRRWQELRDAQTALATTRWRWGLPVVAVLVIGGIIAMNREAVQNLGYSVFHRIRDRRRQRE